MKSVVLPEQSRFARSLVFLLLSLHERSLLRVYCCAGGAEGTPGQSVVAISITEMVQAVPFQRDSDKMR
jgi:hypothetical protein